MTIEANDKSTSLTLRMNEKYVPVFTTNKMEIHIYGGRGRGGSYVGSQIALANLIKDNYCRVVFVRRVYNDIRSSIWREMLDRIDDNKQIEHLFRIKKNPLEITNKKNGNYAFCIGTTGEKGRTAKMKSLPSVTHVIIEEADELNEEDFKQLKLSIRTDKIERIQIILIFNSPHANHWIWKNYDLKYSGIQGFYKPSLNPDKGKGILSIFGTYKDNIKNLNKQYIEEIEYNKNYDKPYYYHKFLGLVPDGADGQIYIRWKPISDEEFDRLSLPKIYAIDFGYSGDPTAVLCYKYNLNTNERYIKEIIYRSGLTDPELALLMRQSGISEKDRIVGDYGGGGDKTIALFRSGVFINNQIGIIRFPYIKPCIKGSGSILSGIKRLQSLDVFYTKNSLNLIEEIKQYKWKKEPQNNTLTKTPIDAFNHLLDAARYAEAEIS